MASLFDWITNSSPDWANHTILNWEDIYQRCDDADMLQFITCEVIENNTSIDMHEVVGQRDHYAGQTWLQAALTPQYKEGKMNDAFRLYEENPNYYFSGALNNGISLSSLNDGPWFSDGGGNHRTIVAKFCCGRILQQTGVSPLVINVAKHHYTVDIEAWEYFARMRSMAEKGVHDCITRVTDSESRTSNRVTSEYQQSFDIGDYRFNSRGRHGVLDSREFCIYARHVLKTNGELSKYEKALHHWNMLFGDMHKLIYMRA
ncbi:MAG: hypothetical protein NT159_24640 [Proteobacteria bacterium]|nr:hypothetical protein [Pseudomonadota bacterium]